MDCLAPTGLCFPQAQPCLRIEGTLGGAETAPHQEYGSRQIRLALPGAYEKPQLLPVQPPVGTGLPATFTFHVNPVPSARLNVELREKLSVLQVSEPGAWRLEVPDQGAIRVAFW